MSRGRGGGREPVLVDERAPWVLVPAKKPEQAKSRLAPVLPPGRRAALARYLLGRTLALLQAVRRRGLVGEIVVVSPDPGLLAMAAGFGARPLVETVHELNAALTQAERYAISEGARATVVLPTDLPRLAVADLARLVRLAPRGPRVVLAPGTRDDGTNALLQRPPALIPFAFGPQSAARHAQLAAERGLPLAILQSPGLALDLDRPEDWAATGLL